MWLLKKNKILFLSLFIFTLAFSLRIWNLGKAGQVWDENSLLRDYAWYHINDAKNLNFGSDHWWKLTPDHPPLVRYLRGIASIPDIEKFDKNGWPVYKYDLTYNRLLSVFLTSFAAVLVFLIGMRYASIYTGLAAGMIFSMLPIALGHSQIVMLEALALFFFTASMYAFFLFLGKPDKKRVILCGIALGFAVLTRETHLMLIPIMLTILFIKHRVSEEKITRAVLYRMIAVFLIGFFTFFLLWPMPFFHPDYIYHYTLSLRAAQTTSIPEVFFGKLMLVPIPYYFVYFIITTPFLILLLGLVGLKKIDRSKNWVWYSLVLWICFPFLLSFYHTRQQGIRYIIQICAPLALIAGMGFEAMVYRFTKKMKYKIALLLLLFVYQFIILWRITPYYIDYFNILVGGAKGVYEKRLFHLAWWGEGIKEAFDYLEKNSPQKASVGIATSPSHILPPLTGRRVVPYEEEKQYDFVVVNFYHVVRIGFDDSKVKRNYKLVYSVMADGAHLVDVYKKK